MRRRLASASLCFLFCSGGPVFAADQGLVQRIVCSDVLWLGAAQGPGVALATAPRQAIGSLGQRASVLLRPPLLTLGGGYRSGALSPGAELSVSLAQEVPLAGLGKARSELAKSYARSVDSDTRRARLEGATRRLDLL